MALLPSPQASVFFSFLHLQFLHPLLWVSLHLLFLPNLYGLFTFYLLIYLLASPTVFYTRIQSASRLIFS